MSERRNRDIGNSLTEQSKFFAHDSCRYFYVICQNIGSHVYSMIINDANYAWNDNFHNLSQSCPQSNSQ